MIWVVGAQGMLGRDLCSHLDELSLAYIDSDRECDITDLDAIRSLAHTRAADDPIEWILNCSAYTAVDRAEEEEDLAYKVNATGAANLGRLAGEMDARIVHISTDYVFDGNSRVPYSPEATVGPRSAYGRTKAAGETLLAEATSRYFIVRTAWLYGVHGRSFVSTMLRLMNERDEVAVVDDQHGSPTYTRDLAAALAEIVRHDSRSYGFYHFTNEGETTWFEFARAILEIGRRQGFIRRDCRLRSISTEEYPTKAERPRFSVLSTIKIRRELGISIPSWRDGLSRYFAELSATEESTSRKGGKE